ncbi:MAG: signal peptidase I [Minisyncoccia bacterium]|jgi:signal peptidase I
MKKFLWSVFEVVETIIIAVAAVFIVRSFIAQPFLVSGSSMEPGFSNGNYLLVDELTYHFRNPERGEVVVFKYPKDPSSYFIKRIIGLPGETVEVNNGQVEIMSGGSPQILREPYILQKMDVADFTKKLGPDEYFVMGDNRNFSFDSRSWGPLPKDDLVGVVRFRLWPVSEAMAFTPPAY